MILNRPTSGRLVSKCCLQGYARCDRCTAIRGIDFQPPSQLSQTGPHTRNSYPDGFDSPALIVINVTDPMTVVLDLELRFFRANRNLNSCSTATGVPVNIVQTFLDDAEECKFHIR